MASAEELMTALENTAQAVALLTGIKTQFINNGWDERMSEAMVIEMQTHANHIQQIMLQKQ